MSLTEYRKKRDFKKSPEPPPSARKSGAAPTPRGLVYVIQRHNASHLHWDLRLEEGGELLSWAVPKEPPPKEGVRRLAVQVENHALEYAGFEGVIPEGEYGAGTVEIWDRGTYRPLETESGRRVVELQGRRLKGSYALIKLKARDTKDKNWLFFKLKPKTK
jgi:DNA ligase D-like protein (predicted 3'-phosphoesterase)